MKIKIKEVCEAQGLTLLQLCYKLNVNENTLYSWASGRRQPHYYNLERLCKILKCDVGDLMTVY